MSMSQKLRTSEFQPSLHLYFLGISELFKPWGGWSPPPPKKREVYNVFFWVHQNAIEQETPVKNGGTGSWKTMSFSFNSCLEGIFSGGELPVELQESTQPAPR